MRVWPNAPTDADENTAIMRVLGRERGWVGLSRGLGRSALRVPISDLGNFFNA